MKTEYEIVQQLRSLLSEGGTPSGPTFVEVWRRYYREEGRGHRTADRIDTIGKLLCAFAGELPALQFTTEKAEDYRDLRRDPQRCERLYAAAGVLLARREPRPATINRELVVGRRALQWAVENRVLPSNPLWTVRREEEDNVKSAKIRSEAELQRLLVASDPVMRAVVLLGIDSGMRRMEALSLQWSQIGLVTVSGKKRPMAELWKTKNGQRRRVGLTSRTYEALQALPRDDKFVFPGREPGRYRKAAAPIRSGSHLTPDAFNRRFKKLCVRSGVVDADGRPLTLHDLRHSFAYLGRVVYKLPEQTLMKQGGWRTRSAFDRYGIGGEEELASMYEHINARIAETGGAAVQPET